MRAHRLGIAAAVASFAVDQASKLWLLHGFDLAGRAPVRLAPVLDLVLAWNRGISYSLLTANTDVGRYALIAATLAATVLLAAWLRQTRSPRMGFALGLLIGGALGNLLDRFLYGAVMDFVWFHVGHFSWYIFNGADCAIVAGVVVLVLEWVFPAQVFSRDR